MPSTHVCRRPPGPRSPSRSLRDLRRACIRFAQSHTAARPPAACVPANTDEATVSRSKTVAAREHAHSRINIDTRSQFSTPSKFELCACDENRKEKNRTRLSSRRVSEEIKKRKVHAKIDVASDCHSIQSAWKVGDRRIQSRNLVSTNWKSESRNDEYSRLWIINYIFIESVAHRSKRYFLPPSGDGLHQIYFSFYTSGDERVTHARRTVRFLIFTYSAEPTCFADEMT